MVIINFLSFMLHRLWVFASILRTFHNFQLINSEYIEYILIGFPQEQTKGLWVLRRSPDLRPVDLCVE